MNLVNKCLSELDLSKEEMDRIFSSSNIQSDKALALIYEINANGNADTKKKQNLEMQLENEYKRTGYVKHEHDDDLEDNAHYNELKDAISELISVYNANMEQRKELITQAKSAISEKKGAAAAAAAIEPVLLAIQDIMQTDFTVDYLPKVINDLKTIENLSHLNIDEINEALTQKIEKYRFNIENISKES